MKRKNSITRRNATFIEYAMLAGLVAVVVAVAVLAFGGKLKELFSDTTDRVTEVDEVVKKSSLTPSDKK